MEKKWYIFVLIYIGKVSKFFRFFVNMFLNFVIGIDNYVCLYLLGNGIGRRKCFVKIKLRKYFNKL